jgi:hypothetical protein
LTIVPGSKPPKTGVWAFDQHGTSSAAGFHLFERTGDGVRLALEHFSSYDIAFQIDDIPWTQREKFLRGLGRTMEEQLAAEVAYYVALLRQAELLGQELEYDKVDIARGTISAYRRLIIGPLVAVADRSCADAQAAQRAYLVYQQQRQVLGVGDDPAFDLGAGTLVPDALLDLTVNRCFEEAYKRCATSGDFSATLQYFFQVFMQNETVFGALATEQQVALAQGYLRRCGHWRVKVTTSDHLFGTPDQHDVDTATDLDVHWQPGSGQYSIVGGRLEGSAPLTVLRFADKDLVGYRVDGDVEVRIERLTFDHPEGPTQTGELLPPTPKALALVVDMPVIEYTVKDVVEAYHESFFWEWVITERKQSRGGTQEEFDALLGKAPVPPFTIDRAWDFTTNPFKAVLPVAEVAPLPCEDPCGYDLKVDIEVEHAPQ